MIGGTPISGNPPKKLKKLEWDKRYAKLGPGNRAPECRACAIFPLVFREVSRRIVIGTLDHRSVMVVIRYKTPSLDHQQWILAEKHQEHSVFFLGHPFFFQLQGLDLC